MTCDFKLLPFFFRAYQLRIFHSACAEVTHEKGDSKGTIIETVKRIQI